MTDRRFKFHVQGEYATREHTIAKLTYEHLTGDGWRRYDPENYTAGFLVFLYALFNCQHMYFRMKTAERNIQISKVSGTLDAETKENWELTRLDIHIDGQLVSGKPTEDDLAYIVDCMEHCPASVNLKFGNVRTTVAIT